MAKLKNKLWNWGHLEKSHNECTLLDCKMTPEQFGEVYGINNAFIVSYGGNIQPPFDKLADRFSVLDEVKWSVVGDCSSPVSDNETGDTDYIIEISKTHPNVTGGVMDDFFSEERMKRFPPEVLQKIHKKLNKNNLDFWCVLYDHQLDADLERHLECFDGITFWLWGCEKILDMDKFLEKFYKLAKGKKVMLGMYLWDYKDIGKQPMDSVLFEKQLKKCIELVKGHKAEGIIFCSSTVGDAELETNRILKKYIDEYGEQII